MANFDMGETVICSCEVKDDRGNYKDPDTSMNITINALDANKEIITPTVMTRDSTGNYHYDFASAGNNAGRYEAKYIATDAARITIEKESFGLR